jgi:hypothetical protein
LSRAPSSCAEEFWEKARRIFTYEGEIRPHSGEVRDISAAGSVSLFMEENPTATIALVRAFLDKKQ